MTVNAPTLHAATARPDGTTVRLALTPPPAGDYDHTQVLHRLRDVTAWTTGPTYTGAQGEAGTVDVEGLATGQVAEFIAYAVDPAGAAGPPSIPLRVAPTTGAGDLRQRIMDDVKAALYGISVAAGYWADVATVYETGHPEDLTAAAYPLMIVRDPQATPEGEAIAGAFNATTESLRLIVIGASKRPASAAQDWEAAEARRIADAVIKAILEDPSRGGLAIDTTQAEALINPMTEDVIGDAVAAVAFLVRFRHQRDNPSVRVPA
jgi:hypothetical protein